MASTPTEAKRIVDSIAASWSREKDNAQRGGLEHEIQFQLGCSYGHAASLANAVRLRWPVAGELSRCEHGLTWCAECDWPTGNDAEGAL